MTETLKTDSLEKLRDLLEGFFNDENVQVTEIEDGFVLDIPVEYDKFPDEEIDEDLDSVTHDEIFEEELEKEDLSITESRKQYVYVTVNRKGLQDEEIIQVFTICAPEEEDFYQSALMLNMTLPFGAIAISKVDDKNYFVLVDTYLVGSVTKKEMAISIMSLAKAGDKMERFLVGEDVA